MEQAVDTGVFTIGYEGKAADDFVDNLLDSGVQVLVDVREMPMSRKRGFSKKALSELVQRVGIEYVHIRALGSPSDSRKKLRQSGDFESFSREYADHLQENTEHVEELVELIGTGRRTALMCFERDHTRCHRSLLVGVLLDGSSVDVEVHHL